MSPIRLAVAPINWTNDDVPDLGDEISFEHCISEMALAGYEGCEVGRKFPVAEPDRLRHLLKVRGLQICNQWHSIFLSSQPLAENIAALRQRCAFLQRLGAKVIGVSEQTGSIQANLAAPAFTAAGRPQLDAEGWRRLLEGSNILGKIAWEEYGIRLAYHLHIGTVIEKAAELLRYLEGTDPRYVFSLFDCGHTLVGGGEPLTLLTATIDRVAHVHAKSVRLQVLTAAKQEKWSFLRAVRAGIFTVPGDGDLEVAPLIEILRQHHYRGWLVVEAEQDPAQANPFEYAVAAHRYLSRCLAEVAA